MKLKLATYPSCFIVQEEMPSGLMHNHHHAVHTIRKPVSVRHLPDGSTQTETVPVQIRSVEDARIEAEKVMSKLLSSY